MCSYLGKRKRLAPPEFPQLQMGLLFWQNSAVWQKMARLMQSTVDTSFIASLLCLSAGESLARFSCMDSTDGGEMEVASVTAVDVVGVDGRGDGGGKAGRCAPDAGYLSE